MTIKQTVSEDSIAMGTLHPGTRPVIDDSKSKLSAITSVIGAMHSMSSDELTKWYNDAMALIGKEASHLPASANEKGNEASIRMKPSHAIGSGGASVNMPMPKIGVKEDVEEMFVGSELSEEFKEKATTIFEAAVNARAMLETVRLEEEFEAKLSEAVADIAETTETQLNNYLDYVTEKWMSENEVAIESALRNEVMEEFVDGLKNLFTEHYISIPEEKIDVIEKLSEKVETLEASLNDTISENVKLKAATLVSEKVNIVSELAEGLNKMQAEKFNALSEGVEFTGDLDAFRKKLAYVKEAYFPVTKNKQITESINVLTETFEPDESKSTLTSTDPEIRRIATAMSKGIRKP